MNTRLESLGSRRRAIALAVALGFFALQVGWILAVPPFAGIDEIDHAYRASAVASGHWAPGREAASAASGGGDYLEVRSGLVRAAGPVCTHVNLDRPARCLSTPSQGGDVQVASSAARYNPVFYAVVGSVTRFFKGTPALYAMRLVSALLCAAILGLATWVTATWARTAWPLAALMLAITPTTVYSGSVVAPNGAEIAAGVLLWTALVGWAETPKSEHRRVFGRCAAFALVVLVNFHTLGILWASLTGATLWVAYGSRWLRAGWRTHRPSTASIVCGAVGCLTATCWTLAARTNDPRMDPTYDFHLHADSMLSSLYLWPLQAVAAFPDRFDLGPAAVYLVLIPTMAAVFGGGVVAMRRHSEGRLMAAVVVVLLTSTAVPLLATFATYRHLGIAWQGRYCLPYSTGAILLAALALDRHARARGSRWFAASGLITGAVALVSQLAVVRQVMASGDWWRTRWTPPGPVTLTTLCLLGCVGFAIAWVRLRNPHTSTNSVQASSQSVLAPTIT